MTTQQLLGADIALTVAMSVSWLGTAILCVGAVPRRALAVLVVAVVLTIARVGVVVALSGRGWWFVQDKVLLALPLVFVPAVLAVYLTAPRLWRRSAIRPSAVLWCFVTAFAAMAGLAITLVIGYPVGLLDAIAVVLTLVGVGFLTSMALSVRRRTGAIIAAVLVTAAPVVLSGAGAWYGGTAAHADHGQGIRTVADLRTPAVIAGPVKRFTLVAGTQTVALPSGKSVDAWTFGSLPGPEIRVQQGDVVEVTVRNRNIVTGVTVHWHGVLVPNGEDGVAGVTQNAILPGASYVYRFRADEVGTYWYHTHQVSSEAVIKGLYGSFIVVPATSGAVDVAVPIHTIEGATLMGATDTELKVPAAEGESVRLRLINTDPVPHRVSVSGSPYRVVAVDGSELNGPSELMTEVLRIPAGGRYDITVDDAVIAVEGAEVTTLVGVDAVKAPFVDGPDLDLLSYGSPSGVAVPTTNREAVLVLDRQLRFLGGSPTYAHTVNGRAYPLVPPITVAEGDRLLLTVVNRGFETHPMHPHGHRVLVLSRDGVRPTGSPLWLDTFDVQPGEVWQVLLIADNPGIWMAHCHNLEHAAGGMVVHLNYVGVSSPYQMGGTTDNQAE